ncbi:related to methionyl-tRNA formyltransferase precursor, mitochondrial [Cephalotrichum gorgonifer]|uniref:Related to methionyl-tRNA formyltransferase, mitochondrial n=1 Tax=Cephalotrichum gorgonifer TaxID=2041049 RepID=A0AAE8SZ51_9PEZI|nr:related to methionyl-tRNA formyltransferase precursor, mitochondrial [Cephalotrichum gorgonifer]
MTLREGGRRALRRVTLSTASTSTPPVRRPLYKLPSDPLRILFCGSDDFSCAALEALDRERVAGRGAGLIESIDVLVRPAKFVGRGYKTLREVAVSFGLFIPPRFLRTAKYGGLNLHPSFLPDLRGAAPLHHALLQNRTHTGITLQTLDEHKFDHGLVLAQTPRPGIPIPPRCTVPQLIDLVKGPAAELLVSGLNQGLHAKPVEIRPRFTGEKIRYAPKLTKRDRWLDWGSAPEEVERRLRVLGPLWTQAVGKKGRAERIIFRDAEEVVGDDAAGSVEGGAAAAAAGWKEVWREVEFLVEEGAPVEEAERVRVRYCVEFGGSVILEYPTGGRLRVREAVVEGMPVQSASRALAPFAL